MIPLHLERRSAAEPIYLQGMLQIGVCEEICIPAMLEIAAMLILIGLCRQNRVVDHAAHAIRKPGLKPHIHR